MGQKLVENAAKIGKFKCDILSHFQTLWLWVKITQKVSFLDLFAKKVKSFLQVWGWDISVDFPSTVNHMRKKYLKKIRQSDLFWNKTDFAVSDFRKLLSLINYRVCQQVWSVFKNHLKKVQLIFQAKNDFQK